MCISDLEDIGDRECDIFGFYRNVRFIKLQDQKAASTKLGWPKVFSIIYMNK